MTSKKSKSSEIRIEIYKANALSFDLKNESISEKDLHIDNLSLFLGTEFRVDEENERVGIKIILLAHLKETKAELFGLTSFFEFGILDLKKVLVKKEKGSVLVPELAKKLLHISIGGSRGMLAVYLSTTIYKNFTLPIANIPQDFFEKD